MFNKFPLPCNESRTNRVRGLFTCSPVHCYSLRLTQNSWPEHACGSCEMLTNSSHVAMPLNGYYHTIISADEYVASVLFVLIALCVITSRKIKSNNTPSNVFEVIINYNYPLVSDDVFLQVRLTHV